MNEEIYYWSPGNRGFYVSSLFDDYEAAGTLPSDLKEVSERYYNYLHDRQSKGWEIQNDQYGMPVVRRTKPDFVWLLERARSSLMSVAAEVVSAWRTELELGIITETDRANLLVWSEYIRELRQLTFKESYTEEEYESYIFPKSPTT